MVSVEPMPPSGNAMRDMQVCPALADQQTIDVQVCYALPGQQTIVDVRLPADATLRDAIDASGILARHPRIALATQRVGVFGRIRPLHAALKHGDRVEIYRPLSVDPKLARQRRVDKARKSGSMEGRKWLRKESV
jgi:putative ubiquitin-RnfH superfamily antitoxin RatB of RatAB toxin-antitoxin module